MQVSDARVLEPAQTQKLNGGPGRRQGGGPQRGGMNNPLSSNRKESAPIVNSEMQLFPIASHHKGLADCFCPAQAAQAVPVLDGAYDLISLVDRVHCAQGCMP